MNTAITEFVHDSEYSQIFNTYLAGQPHSSSASTPLNVDHYHTDYTDSPQYSTPSDWVTFDSRFKEPFDQSATISPQHIGHRQPVEEQYHDLEMMVPSQAARRESASVAGSINQGEPSLFSSYTARPRFSSVPESDTASPKMESDSSSQNVSTRTSRKRSSISSATSTSSPKRIDATTVTETPEERVERIRKRNRFAAEKFRQKQKDLELTLQTQVMQLSETHAHLLTEIESLQSEVTSMMGELNSHIPVCSAISPRVESAAAVGSSGALTSPVFGTGGAESHINWANGPVAGGPHGLEPTTAHMSAFTFDHEPTLSRLA